MNRSFRTISAQRRTRRTPLVLRLILVVMTAGMCFVAPAGRTWSQEIGAPQPLAEIWYGTKRVAASPAKPAAANPPEVNPPEPKPAEAKPPESQAPTADASGHDESSATSELAPLIFAPPDEALPALASPSTWPATRDTFAAPPYVSVEPSAAPASFPSHPWDADSEASSGEASPFDADDPVANQPAKLGGAPEDAESAASPAVLKRPIIERARRTAEAAPSPWKAAAAAALYFLLGAALGPAIVAFLLVRWFKRSREPLFRVEVINSAGGEATWGWASGAGVARPSDLTSPPEDEPAVARRGAVSLEPPPLALPDEETYDARRRRSEEQQGEQEQEILKQLLEDNLELRRQLGEAPLE